MTLRRIPQAFIDELLERTSLVDVIDPHATLKKKGASYLARCPFHDEKTPSFNVNPIKQFYYCFGCGASGNAISFLMDYLKMDFLTAIDNLASKAGMEVPKVQSTQAASKNKPLYALLEKVCHFYQAELKKAPAVIDYLKNRGISGATAKDFQLGFAPPGWDKLLKAFKSDRKYLIETGMIIQGDQGKIYDRYRNRLMFPIKDRRGHIIGFGGRVIDKNDNPKYLNSPETSIFHKGRELYGLYQLTQSRPSDILIVEGYMDVISLAEKGINNAVATLGTATNEQQIQILLRVAKSLVFCFDGDEAGKKAAWRALTHCLPLLDDDAVFKFMFLPQGEDPDSLIQKEGKDSFLIRLEEAPAAVDFFVSELRKLSDLSTPQGRNHLIQIAKEPMSKIPHSANREIILDKLSQLARIDKYRLESLLISNNEVPEAPKPQKTPHNKPSAARTALAILVQDPMIYKKLEKPINPSMLSGESHEIITELISIIGEKSNTAQLIEHWRGKKHESIIKKLACLNLTIPAEGNLAELQGAIDQLEKMATMRSIENMLKKASSQSLDDSERQKLQEMIKFVKEKTA